MVAADVTGDGVPDLVMWPGFANTLSVLPGDGSGGFQPRIDYSATGAGGTIAVADITSDGKPDMVVSGGAVFVATCVP